MAVASNLRWAVWTAGLSRPLLEVGLCCPSIRLTRVGTQILDFSGRGHACSGSIWISRWMQQASLGESAALSLLVGILQEQRYSSFSLQLFAIDELWSGPG